MNLSIVAFSSLTDPLSESLVTFCEKEDLPLHELKLGEGEVSEKVRVMRLNAFLQENRLKEKSLLMVVSGSGIVLTGSKDELISRFDKQSCDILFAADANFNFNESPLQYYYWKFYPRQFKYYNYLNAEAFIGEVSNVREMVRDIQLAYHLDTNEVNPDDPYYTRYYVDSFLEIFDHSYTIGIDGDQQLLAGVGGSVGGAKWPYLNWVVDHFLNLSETQKAESDSYKLSKVRGIQYLAGKDSFRNSRTKTNPLVVTIPSSLISSVKWNGSNSGAWLSSFFSYLQAFGRFLIVFLVNRFSIDRNRTFRFEKHKNPDYESTMQQFLKYLKSGEAFTFAHFNDGELNFIRKYLSNDHKKTWNGRIQDQYDVPLAERLLDAIKYKQDNYFLGVSCSTCAAPRRKVADELIGEYRGKIGAMVFHHNLFYLPQLIHQMTHREMFFVMNDYQQLDILENLGVTVKEENKMKIPFVNSHKEYDNLKDRKFPEGAFVILMCGMLAKVLIRNWYELNPKTTFIAFGSTMDDFIQTSNTNYRPYPKKLPLTRNVHLIKSFLFGQKKQCKECYNITLN